MRELICIFGIPKMSYCLNVISETLLSIDGSTIVLILLLQWRARGHAGQHALHRCEMRMVSIVVDHVGLLLQ